MPALVIRNGTVITLAGVIPADVAIQGGKIAAIGPNLPRENAEIDATGLHLFPGVIDPHVHFNEPGRTEWEGYATGSAALAAGGGTTFFEMPLNASPPTLDGASFDAKLAAAVAASRTDFALWGGLTPGNLDHLEELADRGVIGFKAFMSNSGIEDFGRADDLTLYRGMKTAAKLGLIVAVHAESEEITSRLTAEIRAAGGQTWRDYLNSRPIVAELEAITRAITLAEDAGCKLHIVHVSSARGAELVARARSHGVDVTCETCPHYLALTEHDLEHMGARAKCAPPVRSREEAEGLWQSLAEGRFALVASDHSPAPSSMKSGQDAFSIWGGIAGVQSTLPILLSRSPKLSIADVAALTASNVASRFNLKNKGQLAAGYDADIALVDLDGTFELTRDSLHDRHKLSPYVGRTFQGQVRRTLLRGQTIFADWQSTGVVSGQFVRPSR